MTNPTPPLSNGRSVNNAIMLSSITRDLSVSHKTAVVSAAQASLRPGGDDNSILPQRIRTRDKIRNFFRSANSEVKDNTRIVRPEPKIYQVGAASVDANNNHPNVDFDDETGNQRSSAIIELDLPRVPSIELVRAAIFPSNVIRPEVKVALPKLGERIEMTSQLVLCLTLLAQNALLSPSDPRIPAVAITLSEDEKAWIRAIEQNPVKQAHMRWLGSRMVEEFIKDTAKGPVAISEVILLGPVLECGHYRKLLTCFIKEFKESILLDVDLLQGLIQLIQCALPGYLDADDLIKILRTLRTRLEDTHQQSSEHQYHITLAVSRLLDVMAEPEYKVSGLPRVEESEPLASVLSGLKTSSDPYLMYQALYAFQALQYVPNDESNFQSALRHVLETTGSLIKVSGVVQLNFDGLLEGLKTMQKTIEETYGIAESCCEGIRSLIDSGHGLFDSLRKGILSAHKHPWYPAILSATAFCRAGQLEDLGKLIREAPCRPDPRFQWGISQLLGEIAVDPIWETSTREQAINFLGDLYMNDTDWGHDDSVKYWMRTIIGKISETPDHAVQEAANALLLVLKKNGASTVTHPYPLRSHLPIPATSPLLALVQEIPYVEDDLDNLRLQRLQEYNQRVYIPPRAKANLQASDNDTLPLMKKVKEFLDSDGQVLLVLGDSGAGKSTFNRHLEYQLWKEYKQTGLIPLFINLPAIDHPEHDLIGKQLRNHNFSDSKIQELKQHRQIILICDGYDETQLKVNLHTANMLNRKGQADTKMIISCRSTYLGQDYRDQFQPQQSDRYRTTPVNLYTEAVIVPFTNDQIKDYVDQFVRDSEVHKLTGERPIWSTEDYVNKLKWIPNLMELVKNPFLLSLSLRALPGVVKDEVDLANIKVTRLSLYDSFIDQWLEINKLRLKTIKLSMEAENTFQELLDEGFNTIAIRFLKDLAATIFREQDGNPVVQYMPRSDKGTWKAKFFGVESSVTLLRESSPLSRVGVHHRFIHRSLLEYFYSRHVYETTTKTDGLVSTLDLEDYPLNQRNLVKEPSVVQFLAEHVQHDPVFKQRLHQIINRSKKDAEASQAAANAITILVRAGTPFNRVDLKGIQIPGADLSGGQFDSAQLQGSDLRTVNLRNVWLRQADLSNTQMAGVQFGELPFLEENDVVSSCAYSPDGKTFAVGLMNSTISLYDTATWEKTSTLKGHTGCVTSVVFSPSGQQIASGSYDKTVRLWDAQTGAPGAILSGHTNWVTSAVFSPSGQQIASGSWDNTVRLWDAQTGAPGAILSGHTNWVTSVVFSPSGQQIASGSEDSTVRLWDAKSGECLAIVKDFLGTIQSIAWNTSDNGSYIATGCNDKSVRLWQVIGEHHVICLQWSSVHDQLVVSNTTIPCAQGLSGINMKLLKQRGAVGNPISSQVL